MADLEFESWSEWCENSNGRASNFRLSGNRDTLDSIYDKNMYDPTGASYNTQITWSGESGIRFANMNPTDSLQTLTVRGRSSDDKWSFRCHPWYPISNYATRSGAEWFYAGETSLYTVSFDDQGTNRSVFTSLLSDSWTCSDPAMVFTPKDSGVNKVNAEAYYSNTGLASNKTVTITYKWTYKRLTGGNGTGTKSWNVEIRPALTGINITWDTQVLNNKNNYSAILTMHPLPTGTQAPIRYSFTNNTPNITPSIADTDSRNVAIYGIENDVNCSIVVTAYLRDNPARRFSTTYNCQVRPNMQVYNGGFRAGQPYVNNGGLREGVQVFTYNGGFRRNKIR